MLGFFAVPGGKLYNNTAMDFQSTYKPASVSNIPDHKRWSYHPYAISPRVSLTLTVVRGVGAMAHGIICQLLESALDARRNILHSYLEAIFPQLRQSDLNGSF